jgi:hypothetical protein
MPTTYRAVNGNRRCPVCNSAHKCGIGADGSIQCGRVPDGLRPGQQHNDHVFMGLSPKDSQFGIFRHVNDPELERRERQRREEWERDHRGHGKPAANGTPKAQDMEARARKLAHNLAPEHVAALAQALGLPEWVLSQLPDTGYSPTSFHKDHQGHCWTFAERNAAGKITGIVCRYGDGSKPSMTGSGRGIYIPTGWRERGGAVYLVEGASDVLTMTALGLSALGRPNNRAGVNHLRDLLRDVPADRPVIVIGEMDAKRDGTWPGRDGAVDTAAALARGLGRPVLWVLPPDGKKDVRKWVLDQQPDPACADEWSVLGERLRADLDAAAKEVKPAAGPGLETESFSAPDLLRMELPEPKYAVNGVIPEGMSTLAGKPKLGKSWLAYGLAISVSEGGTALGTIQVEAGDVLYLALEDTKRRLKDRLLKLLSKQQGVPPERLTLTTKCPRQGAGGLDFIEAWINSHPGARLVIVDTWPKFRPPKARGKDPYEEDYEHAAQLKALADKYGVAILVIAHCRKLEADDPVDSVSGTLGLTGACDGVLVLKRERGQHNAALFVTGRDIEERELALKFDTEYAMWYVLGDAEAFRVSTDRAAVVELLKKANRPMTAAEAAPLLNKTVSTAQKLFWRMAEDGQLLGLGRGVYALCVANAA